MAARPKTKSGKKLRKKAAKPSQRRVKKKASQKTSKKTVKKTTKKTAKKAAKTATKTAPRKKAAKRTTAPAKRTARAKEPRLVEVDLRKLIKEAVDQRRRRREALTEGGVEIRTLTDLPGDAITAPRFGPHGPGEGEDDGGEMIGGPRGGGDPEDI